jgi:hypothetical protein
LGILAPVTTASPETVEQHQAWLTWIPQASPVTSMALPRPGAVIPPIHIPGEFTGRLKIGTAHRRP